MQQAAFNTYSSMQKEGLSGRALEAQVLNRAANLLKECQNRWGAEGHEDRFDTAVRFNQKVWTFFQAELTDPNNPLPREIKENILSLSIFIDKRLLELLMDPSPDKLAVVININMNIAAGLMEKPKEEPASVVTASGKLKVSA